MSQSMEGSCKLSSGPFFPRAWQSVNPGFPLADMLIQFDTVWGKIEVFLTPPFSTPSDSYKQLSPCCNDWGWPAESETALLSEPQRVEGQCSKSGSGVQRSSPAPTLQTFRSLKAGLSPHTACSVKKNCDKELSKTENNIPGSLTTQITWLVWTVLSLLFGEVP